MSKYIVERGNSQPRILVRGEDDTYSVLTHGTGDGSLNGLLDLVREANLWHEDPA